MNFRAVFTWLGSLPSHVPSLYPRAWQVPAQSSWLTSHLEGNKFLRSSQSIELSLHLKIPIVKLDYYNFEFSRDIYQHSSSLSHMPEVWPKVTHEAEQAQSPKVHRNPASERPKAKAKTSKNFMIELTNVFTGGDLVIKWSGYSTMTTMSSFSDQFSGAR